MIKPIIIILFFSLGFNVQAQTTANPQTDTLRWNASGFTDLIANKSAQVTKQFITYGTGKIDFIQKDGKLTYTLTVSSVDGTWSDANVDGTITYNITFNEMMGTLSITRSSGAITITLNVTSVSNMVNNQYAIANFDIL